MFKTHLVETERGLQAASTALMQAGSPRFCGCGIETA